MEHMSTSPAHNRMERIRWTWVYPPLVRGKQPSEDPLSTFQAKSDEGRWCVKLLTSVPRSWLLYARARPKGGGCQRVCQAPAVYSGFLPYRFGHLWKLSPKATGQSEGCQKVKQEQLWRHGRKFPPDMPDSSHYPIEVPDLVPPRPVRVHQAFSAFSAPTPPEVGA